MRKNLLAIAAMAALAAPALASAASLSVGAQRSGWDPRRIFGGGKRVSERQRRNPSRLQMQCYCEIPCDAPAGYFWKLQASGIGYRLYATPPGARKVIRDEANGRLIIFSGWGYVKPTYQPMEGT